MARYFFHERSVGEYHVDEHGIDLPDLEAVRREAIAGARSIIAAAALTGRLSLEVFFEVTDAQGTLVLTLPFSSAVQIDAYDRLINRS